MQVYGKSTIAEFLGDNIVYRNLVPMDTRLPTLDDVRASVGIAEGITPRKSEMDYARVIAAILKAAHKLNSASSSLARIVYVGDTRLNDGTAFVNICRAARCPGMAFIGSENDAPPAVETVEQDAGTTFIANRWSLLQEFDALCDDYDFRIDARTAVIVDLDKTALGARGRNDHVINQARVSAVRRTVGTLLGDAFDAQSFQRAYDTLNQTEFHPFTTDNQDYLAYMCLIVGSGLFQLTPLVNVIREGQLKQFAHFVAGVDARSVGLSDDLRSIHADIYARVKQNDPTPFKAFRRNEYHTTTEAMGHHDDADPAEALLADEIVITQEVRAIALKWKKQGALMFGLSDKPDEASIPTEELAAQGYKPIHQVETHIIGE
jgi:hypothetical protein